MLKKINKKMKVSGYSRKQRNKIIYVGAYNRRGEVRAKTKELKHIPASKLPNGWVEQEGSDEDFMCWNHKRFLMRIWKTAEVRNKNRTGRFFYDYTLEKLGENFPINYRSGMKTFSSVIAIEKALKLMREASMGKYD